MNNDNEFTLDMDGLNCSVQENYGLIHIQCNVFENLIDLQKDQKVMEWLDKMDNNENVSGVLVINEPGCLGVEAYNKFLSDASGKELDITQHQKISNFQKTQIRAIEINMLMAFIKKMVNFSKLLVLGFRGEVVTPFFGLSLAADIRLIAPSTKFSLSHVNYGLHPSGALPFMLPKFVGQGTAIEMLMQGGEISGENALKLGLANALLSEDNFVDQCKEKCKEYFSVDRNVVKSTKDLLYHYKKDLYRYFDEEANYLYA